MSLAMAFAKVKLMYYLVDHSMHAVRQLIRKSLGGLLVWGVSCFTFAAPNASVSTPVNANVDTAKSTSLNSNPGKSADTAEPTSPNSTEDTAELEQAADTSNHDPYERFNRAMFQFNETFDILVMKPIATLYIKIIPKPLSKGLSNFYNNIDTIPTVANDLLQANFYQGTSDAWRLAINSTIGIVGFFDFATDMGLEPNKEDFGLTLAQWGYRNSNYLVLPFLGPGTVRDQVAWPINYLFLTIYPHIYPVTQRNALYLSGLVVKRAELLRYQNVLAEASLDDYTFIRDAYMQRRTYQLERNAELNDPYLEKNSNAEQSSSSPDESAESTESTESTEPAEKVN